MFFAYVKFWVSQICWHDVVWLSKVYIPCVANTNFSKTRHVYYFFDYVRLVVSKLLARCRQDNVTKLNSNFNAKMAIVCRLFLLPFVGLFFAKINHVSAKNAPKHLKTIAKPASKTANIHQKSTRFFSSFCIFYTVYSNRSRARARARSI